MDELENFFDFDPNLLENQRLCFLNGIAKKVSESNFSYSPNGKNIIIKFTNVDNRTIKEIQDFAQNKICNFELNNTNLYLDVDKIINSAIKTNDIKALDCIDYLLTIKSRNND